MKKQMTVEFHEVQLNVFTGVRTYKGQEVKLIKDSLLNNYAIIEIEMNEVEEHFVSELKKCGEINAVHQTEEYDGDHVKFPHLRVTMELDTVDDEKLEDVMDQLKDYVDDLETDEIQYGLDWRSNWYGEDVLVLVTY